MSLNLFRRALDLRGGAIASLIIPVLALSAGATEVCSPTTGTELTNAVALARADWESTGATQEIVLATGTYEINSEIVLNFPVVLRGATGNPADVTVKHLNTGSNLYRVFTVDHAGAQLLNVTVTGGGLDCLAGKYTRLGAGVRVSNSAVDGANANMSDNYGKGGLVSNCVFTANRVTYKNDSCIIYVNGPADKTLVTCCVITNNTVRRQTDSNTGDGALGSIVHVDSGRFTSSIVRGNTAYNSSANIWQDVTSVVEARGGSVENCQVIGNSVYTAYDPTVVRTLLAGKIVNTVIQDNSVSLSDKSRSDANASWGGVASGFSNCVWKGTSIAMPNDSCFATNNLGYFDESAKDYRLSRHSCLRRAGRTQGVRLTGTDILGKSRVMESGYIDIGPIAYDPSLSAIAGNCESGCLEGGTVTFHVTADEGYGDTPTYYWLLVPRSGGESIVHATTSLDYETVLPVGRYATTLVVSNLTASPAYGGSVTLANDSQVHQRRFYVKSGNPDAAAPYATEETAAAYIQPAIDAVTADGAEVIVAKGLYEIQSNVMVRTHQITLRGATGNPEDVVVRNVTTDKWPNPGRPNDWDERYSHGEGRCLVLDAGPAARVESMTFENGKGFYSVNYSCGLYLADWDWRTTWPHAGKGGTVSNCVVRNSDMRGCKYGIGPGIFARGANYFITHTVISNCVSGAGNSNGGRFGGIGLDLGGGARAEHCLIADNRFYFLMDGEYPSNGRATVGGAMVRDDSVLRFSTVVGNSGAMVGGVNLNGTSARLENSIVLGNWAGEVLACATTTNRFNCWAMMTYTTESDLINTPTKYGEGGSATLAADEIAYVEAHPEAVDAGFVNTITDYAPAGASGVQSTSAKTFKKASKRDYRLKLKSPACDRVAPDAAGTMPPTDVKGAPRLSGPAYDLGCYERKYGGMMMFIGGAPVAFRAAEAVVVVNSATVKDSTYHTSAWYPGAIADLTNVIRKVTGRTSAVYEETDYNSQLSASATLASRPVIYLGETEAAAAAGISGEGLRNGDWRLKTEPGRAFIYAKTAMASSYAVTDFLARCLDYDFLTMDGDDPYVCNPHVTVPVVDVTVKPAVYDRDIYTGMSNGITWPTTKAKREAWQRHVYGNVTPEIEGGYRVAEGPGTAHSIYSYLPPATYFESHPEWYSMGSDGKRRAVANSRSQICYSNAEARNQVYNALVAFVQAEYAAHPENPALVFDMSQMDNTSFMCLCPECKAIIAKYNRTDGGHAEGGDAGLQLEFVNDLASRIRASYPDVKLRVFAYVSTECAPKAGSITVEPNVIIRWCDVYGKSDHTIPLTLDGHFNQLQKTELDEWFAFTDNIQVWDYMLYSKSYPEASPDAIAADAKYFAAAGVPSIFMETEYGEQAFYELNGYLMGRLYVDPNADVDALIRRFCRAYGKGAADMEEAITYLRTIERAQCAADKADWHARLLPWLTRANMEHLAALFQRAYDRETDVTCRARILGPLSSVWYELMMILKSDLTAKAAFDVAKENYRRYAKEWYATGFFEESARATKQAEVDEKIAVLSLKFDELPDELADVPDDELVCIDYHAASSRMADPVSSRGYLLARATTDDSTAKIPFNCGVYDNKSATLSLTTTITAAMLPADGEYHWIRLGTGYVGLNTIFWYPGSWYASVSLKSYHYLTDGLDVDPNWYDFWVSMRVAGPAFVSESTEESMIALDRMVLRRVAPPEK